MLGVLSEAPGNRASPWAAPALPPGLVRRERLHAAIDRAIERPLTVVAAPAGWGKTVLLSAWAADHGAAWVSVGPEHADPSRLAVHLDRALERVAGGRSSAVVLDDVQLLDAAGLAAIRAVVRDGRGPVIVASRSDPDLGLPRLRVEGRLAEVRGADLAFTEDELAALLDVLDVRLAASRRRELIARTDGWVAGIRLAVIALQASSDPDRFLDEFTGDDRVVADYLTDEVLAALPQDVCDFLLRTSIVDQLDVELAAALTGREDAAAMLDELERQGMFVSAVDRRGRSYRYHALFAELLRARLRLEQRSAERALHERAAEWFALQGSSALAVRHALAAGSRATTRALLAEHWLDLMAAGHVPAGTGEGDADPRLALAAAHACLIAGDRGNALGRLAAIESPDGWPGKLADLVRASARHDIDGARLAGAAAIDRGEDADEAADEVGRAIALHLLGASELAVGDVDVAGDRLEEAAALAAISGRERLRLECVGPLAAIEVMRGRLSHATGQARAALDLAHRHGWEAAPSAGWAVAALGAVAWLRGDLSAADRRAEAAAEEASAWRDALLGNAVRGLRAHLRAAHGDEEGGRTLLRLVRDVQSVAGGALGRWLEALGPASWAPSTGDGPAEVAARAMRRLQGGDQADALRLAIALDARAGVHPTVRLSGLLVEAVAREALREPGSAAALERALELAEAEGLRSPFLSAGARLHNVLHSHAGLCDADAPLLAEVLDALPVTQEDGGIVPTEPLSERERAVLRLMPTILANSEIAGELFVSVNTVKTHVKSIYRKLDVGSRREAVARAREVGLL
jgi:LuxR family maltose regulon positive regulatory protein